MKIKPAPLHLRPSGLRMRSPASERGFSLFFTLIALAVLLVATASIMRSSGLNLFSTGNISFQQDMVSRAEQVNVRMYELFRPGGALATNSSLATSSTANNYSALALSTNGQGIPLALINDTTFESAGVASNDINDTDSNTKIRYVVERLCDQAGDAATLGVKHCVKSPDSKPILGGSSTQAGMAIPPSFAPIYRVSIRVQGPRGSETYIQNTFLKPN